MENEQIIKALIDKHTTLSKLSKEYHDGIQELCHSDLPMDNQLLKKTVEQELVVNGQLDILNWALLLFNGNVVDEYMMYQGGDNVS